MTTQIADLAAEHAALCQFAPDQSLLMADRMELWERARQRRHAIESALGATPGVWVGWDWEYPSHSLLGREERCDDDGAVWRQVSPGRGQDAPEIWVQTEEVIPGAGPCLGKETVAAVRAAVRIAMYVEPADPAVGEITPAVEPIWGTPEQQAAAHAAVAATLTTRS